MSFPVRQCALSSISNMGRHKDGVSPVGYPPVARLIPASPRFGRLAGIGSLTGGYWSFDWRVLGWRLAGFGSATGLCVFKDGFFWEKQKSRHFLLIYRITYDC